MNKCLAERLSNCYPTNNPELPFDIYSGITSNTSGNLRKLHDELINLVKTQKLPKSFWVTSAKQKEEEGFLKVGNEKRRGPLMVALQIQCRNWLLNSTPVEWVSRL